MTKSFFSPKSIAVIGASEDEKKLGTVVVKNLKESGFTGRVYPINNKANDDTMILGYKAYPDVHSIHEVPELVVISIPSEHVFDELMKSYAAGTKNFVIITAGFKEINNQEGENLINQFLQTHPDANLLGPNCLGFIDTSIPINASFAASTPQKGNISFFSQSGALCTAVLDWSEKVGMGFSKFVSIGNKNNISENTFLEDQYLNNEPAFFYLESFKNGKEFIQKAKNIKSPMVVLHPGRYSETASAMQSHTGSMASDDRIIDEALKEAGVIRAYGLEDIMDLMMIFNFYPNYRKVQNVAIVSNAGGPGIITTDSIKDNGLNMAELSEQTKSSLSSKLPRTANIHNPIDVVGDALADRYGFALDTVLGDPAVDAVVVLLTPQAMTQIDLTAEYIQRLAKTHNKVVVASFMGGKRVDKYEQYLFSYGIPYFDYPERAVWALSKLNKFEEIKEEIPFNIDDYAKAITSPQEFINTLFKTAKEEEITDTNSLISFLPSQKIALKLISDQMWHKSDSGGVKLSLDNDEKRLDAYNSLISLAENMQKENPDFKYKIVAQEMKKIDLELFIGAKKDDNFGTVTAFGIGGIYANIIDENMLFLDYCDFNYIKNRIEKSKLGKILSGARGQKGINLDLIVKAIQNIQALMKQFPNVHEMDINPLAVVENDIYAIDVKIK